MKIKDDHFAEDGIPLTELQDAAPTNAYLYQLAEIIATDFKTGTYKASQYLFQIVLSNPESKLKTISPNYGFVSNKPLKKFLYYFIQVISLNTKKQLIIIAIIFSRLDML